MEFTSYPFLDVFGSVHFSFPLIVSVPLAVLVNLNNYNKTQMMYDHRSWF